MAPVPHVALQNAHLPHSETSQCAKVGAEVVKKCGDMVSFGLLTRTLCSWNHVARSISVSAEVGAVVVTAFSASSSCLRSISPKFAAFANIESQSCSVDATQDPCPLSISSCASHVWPGGQYIWPTSTNDFPERRASTTGTHETRIMCRVEELARLGPCAAVERPLLWLSLPRRRRRVGPPSSRPPRYTLYKHTPHIQPS